MDPGRLAVGRLALGRLALGRLALGTVPLGNFHAAISDAQAHATIERAVELGVRHFDTAPLYGSGLAERRLGDALREVLRGVPRDELIISTKVGNRLDPTAPPRADLLDNGVPIYKDVPAVNPVVDFAAAAVRRSLAESLERLGLDRVDIVHLHDPEPDDRSVVEEACVELERLRSEGVIRAIGIGSSDPEAFLRLAANTDVDVFLIAGRTTLLDQSCERVLPFCVERGIRVVAAGVFNSGILAAADPAGSTFNYKTVRPETLSRVSAIRAACDAHGVSMIAAAMQYPMRLPGVDTVLVGAASAAELDVDAAALDEVIPEDFWKTVG